jgi:hypothetical protein
MRIFLAGIIQGGLPGTSIHPQTYRDDLRQILDTVVPDAQLIEPHGENPDRLGWSQERQRAMFFDYVAKAGTADLLVAWLPEPSMGTAIEMYEAHRAGVPVLAVTPLQHTWAVFSTATQCFPDLSSLAAFVRGTEFRALIDRSTRSD